MEDFKLSIDTPDNILLDADLAGFGSRCIAAMLDYTILIVVDVVISILIVRSMPPDGNDTSRRTALLVMVQFVLIIFYHLLFEFLWNGQTPGKRWTGLRVVRTNGLPLTASAILIRNLVRVFDFLPALYGVGLLVMFATKNTQRLGDLAARTVVIREQRALKLNTLKEDLRVRYVYVKPIEPLPHYIQLEHLTQEDRRAVVDYLRRRPELRDRAILAMLVARRIARKIDDGALTLDVTQNGQRAEQFLEQVARACEVAEVVGE